MPSVRFQLRRDTAATWAAVNPVLGPGEPALEIDTMLVKYGDGVSEWNSLPYASIDLPAVVAAYADGEVPSAFTLSIVDSPDGPAWLEAIGAQPASLALTAIAATTTISDGEHTVAGIKITTSRGLVTAISPA